MSDDRGDTNIERNLGISLTTVTENGISKSPVSQHILIAIIIVVYRNFTELSIKGYCNNC